MHIWVVSFFCLLWIFVYKFFDGPMFSLVLDKYLELECQVGGNPMFEIWETATRLSTADAPLYNPTSSVGGLPFPHLLATLVTICLFAQSPWNNCLCPRILWFSASFLAPPQDVHGVGWARRRRPSWGPGRLGFGQGVLCFLRPLLTVTGQLMLSLPSGAPPGESTHTLAGWALWPGRRSWGRTPSPGPSFLLLTIFQAGQRVQLNSAPSPTQHRPPWPSCHMYKDHLLLSVGTLRGNSTRRTLQALRLINPGGAKGIGNLRSDKFHLSRVLPCCEIILCMPGADYSFPHSFPLHSFCNK